MMHKSPKVLLLYFILTGWKVVEPSYFVLSENGRHLSRSLLATRGSSTGHLLLLKSSHMFFALVLPSVFFFVSIDFSMLTSFRYMLVASRIGRL